MSIVQTRIAVIVPVAIADMWRLVAAQTGIVGEGMLNVALRPIGSTSEATHFGSFGAIDSQIIAAAILSRDGSALYDALYNIKLDELPFTREQLITGIAAPSIYISSKTDVEALAENGLEVVK